MVFSKYRFLHAIAHFILVNAIRVINPPLWIAG